MTKPLVLVATIRALPGHEDSVESALQALVEPTLAEAGCRQYDLHRDLDTPGFFLFYEIWSTRADWEAHNDSEHISSMLQQTQEMIEDPVIVQLEKIGRQAADQSF